MKKKVYSYKAVYVEWIDSTMRKQVWWGNQELLDDTKKVHDRFQTVAYLVNQNKLEYVFSNSIHFEEENTVGFGCIFTIPKGCVTKMKVVTI